MANSANPVSSGDSEHQKIPKVDNDDDVENDDLLVESEETDCKNCRKALDNRWDQSPLFKWMTHDDPIRDQKFARENGIEEASAKEAIDAEHIQTTVFTVLGLIVFGYILIPFLGMKNVSKTETIKICPHKGSTGGGTYAYNWLVVSFIWGLVTLLVFAMMVHFSKLYAWLKFKLRRTAEQEKNLKKHALFAVFCCFNFFFYIFYSLFMSSYFNNQKCMNSTLIYTTDGKYLSNILFGMTWYWVAVPMFATAVCFIIDPITTIYIVVYTICVIIMGLIAGLFKSTANYSSSE
jgi:hypothetical protein